MGIPVSTRRQIFWPEFRQITWIGAEIGYIDDDELLHRHLCILHQREEEVRGAKAGIDDLDVVGQLQLLKFFNDCRAKSIISIEWVAAPCNHDLTE